MSSSWLGDIDGDRRIYQITVTPAGRERLHAGEQRADMVMGEVLSVFDPSARAQLHELLTRFVAHARGPTIPEKPAATAPRGRNRHPRPPRGRP